MASLGTAFLGAYLHWRRIARRERLALLDRSAGTVDPQLAHALDFSRRALEIENNLVAEAEAKLAQLPKPDGSAAARAGEHACEAAVAVSVAAHIAYLRCAAPKDADLANEAHARAQQLTAAAAKLKTAILATGVPGIEMAAASVAEIIGLSSDLEPATTGGYRQLNELVRDVTAFCDAMPRKLDKPRAPTSPATSVATLDVDALLAGSRGARVKVRGAKGRIAEIVRSPALAKLEALDMDDQGVTDDDLIALAASPYARHLRQLDLRYNPISARGIEALAASPHLQHLEYVHLDGNPADPVDRLEYYDETSTHRVPTAAGAALEAKYGPLRWLHPG